MSAASKLPLAGSENYSTGNARFNAEAAAWDANPFVHAASKHACDAILQRFPDALSKQNPTYDILEIGCGTGLLSLNLAPYAKTYVAVDAAEGMIEVLKRKVTDGQGGPNVVPIAALLEDAEDERLPPGGTEGQRMKFDLITSHLVLHHIPSLEPILRTMLACLKPGTGRVALTDFQHLGPESKRFHAKAKMEGVERHGIEVKEMEGLMRKVGFVDVSVKEGFRMDKRVEKWEGEFSEGGGDGKRAAEGQGEIAVFPFVLCEGRRP